LGQLVYFAIAALMCYPGIRLLMLWQKSRKAPEGLLAIFFLGFGLGVPIRLFSAVNREFSGFQESLVAGVALTALMIGVTALAIFTQMVFRPKSKHALLFRRLTAAAMASSIVSLGLLGELHTTTHPLAMAANAWAIAVFWWAFVECMLQRGKMRRQARLGIGDPVVRNRFLLWALWTGALAMLPSTGIVMKSFLLATTPAGQEVHAPPEMLMIIQAIAVVSAFTACVTIGLSFFPPASYVARLERQAA
jgi:hypothetical protein